MRNEHQLCFPHKRVFCATGKTVDCNQKEHTGIIDNIEMGPFQVWSPIQVLVKPCILHKKPKFHSLVMQCNLFHHLRLLYLKPLVNYKWENTTFSRMLVWLWYKRWLLWISYVAILNSSFLFYLVTPSICTNKMPVIAVCAFSFGRSLWLLYAENYCW